MELGLALGLALGLGVADAVDPPPDPQAMRTMARHPNAAMRSTDVTSGVVLTSTWLYAPTARFSVSNFVTETAWPAT